MNKIIISTTVTSPATQSFMDLGEFIIHSGSVNVDLVGYGYKLEELGASTELQGSLDLGYLTAEDEFNNSILNFATASEELLRSTYDKNDSGTLEALEIEYAVSSSTDWSGSIVPVLVSDALDILAGRAKLIEVGGGVDTDAQVVSGSTQISTSSTTYTDILGMTASTSNTIARPYLILFSGTFTGPSNKVVSMRIMINDVPALSSIRSHKVGSQGSEFGISTQVLSDILPSDIIIKVQWKISSGIVDITDRSLIIYSIEGGVA